MMKSSQLTRGIQHIAEYRGSSIEGSAVGVEPVRCRVSLQNYFFCFSRVVFTKSSARPYTDMKASMADLKRLRKKRGLSLRGELLKQRKWLLRGLE